MSVNKVMLLGRLGQNADIRKTANGKPVANFSLATTERWKDKDGNPVEKTEWHRVTIFGRVVEFIGHKLEKGAAAYVEGRINSREWEKDGVKRTSVEIHADHIEVFSNHERGPGGHGTHEAEAADSDDIAL